MTDYTDEQKKEITAIVEQARLIERWENGEDTIRRQLKAMTDNMIAQGVWHPFMGEVAASMRSTMLVRNPGMPPQQEKPDETEKSD